MSPPPGITISLDSIRGSLGDRYSLERELGRGGMGTVYLARDLKLDRPVALKILLPEFATQPGLRDRFLRETRTAASFSHPNIVPVYAVEESDDYLAYAMGLVEGETLTQRVERAGPLPVRELVRMIQDVGYALAYAHGRGVVHRDIKPDNVMLERATGRALVMDFGISRSMTQVALVTSLTRVGEVVGTPEYMSPEQASGDAVDGRSDLYALGLTAYFAATGQPAVTGDSAQKILVRQLTELIPPVAQSRPDLPRALAEAIDRCVRKDPADRFPTAEALVEEIDAAQLAEPEIPLAIRLFAGELSSLSLAVLGLLVMIYLVVQAQQQANMSSLDIMLPVVGLLAILFTRTLTTMNEGRRLGEAGYTAAEVAGGLARVMAERVTRREELRANPVTRARRHATIGWGAAMLVASIVMVRAALAMRVRIGPTRYQTPPGGIVLVFSGFALLGMSVVLLLKSPFRMPPGERFFRLIWLGPLGRGFVWLSMRGMLASGAPGRRHRATPAVAARPVTAPGMSTASPARVDRPEPVTRSAPSVTALAPDPLAAVEARVSELERWRRSHGD
ncbi:MAG: serine/threonine protein kinase [Gemmatimonadota bacterium]|nr:serine/threonine protein kinase [Gemmatimonadota bacterium]